MQKMTSAVIDTENNYIKFEKYIYYSHQLLRSSKYYKDADIISTSIYREQIRQFQLDVLAILYACKIGAVQLVEEENYSSSDNIIFVAEVNCHDDGRSFRRIAVKADFNYPLGEIYRDIFSRFDGCYDFALVSFMKFVLAEFEESDYLKFADFTLFLDTTTHFFRKPEEVTKLLASLVTLNKGYSVYNPFAGLGEYARYLSGASSYVGDVKTADIAKITSFYVAFFGQKNAKIQCTDSIENWDKNKYDLVISTPPCGLKVVSKNQDFSIESFFISRAVDAIKQNGEVLAVLPAYVLNSDKFYELRQNLVAKKLVDTVILLPSRIFTNTSIATAVIKLKKNRAYNSPVFFVDASELFVDVTEYKRKLDVDAVESLLAERNSEKTRYANKNEIVDNGFSLDPEVYTKTINVPEGHKIVRLDVIANIDLLKSRMIVKKGRYFGYSKDLQVYDKFSYIVDPETLVEEETCYAYAELTSPTLLLHCSRPCIYYVRASFSMPVLVDWNDWFVCKLDERKIDRDYFVYSFLSSDNKYAQSESKRFGEYSHIMSVNSLRKIQFCILPSIEEQKAAVLDAKRIEIHSKIKEEDFNIILQAKKDEIENLRKDYIEEVRQRKHDMKQPMAQLRSTFRLLELLSPTLSKETSDKLNKYIGRQRVALDALSEIVQHLADEEVFAEPEDLNIEEILKSQVVKAENYVVDFFKDEAVFEEAEITNPIVSIGRVDFVRLVQNIIGNAIEHGFVDKNKEYELNIFLSIDDSYFVIDFRNNGKPISEDVTKERYGMKNVKGKDSRGTGRGGYIVKSIVQHYGGDYDIHSSKYNNMTFTNVVVKLPIKSIEHE